jgi:hypothetical protein
MITKERECSTVLVPTVHELFGRILSLVVVGGNKGKNDVCRVQLKDFQTSNFSLWGACGRRASADTSFLFFHISLRLQLKRNIVSLNLTECDLLWMWLGDDYHSFDFANANAAPECLLWWRQNILGYWDIHTISRL